MLILKGFKYLIINETYYHLLSLLSITLKKGVIGAMNLISVKIPETFLEGLDDLVRLGVYPSRSEAIRVAIRDLLRKELWDTKRKGP